MAPETLCVCLCVRALEEKQLELSTPNSLHIYDSRSLHALTLMSESQSLRSHGYENRHGCVVASEVRAYAAGAGVGVRGLHVVRLLGFL